jgi:cysteine protease ATG4
LNKAEVEYKNFIWFSYRKIPGLSKEFGCDTGWGCLIRVGQMALATALRRELDLVNAYRNVDVRLNVIVSFLENNNGRE